MLVGIKVGIQNIVESKSSMILEKIKEEEIINSAVNKLVNVMMGPLGKPTQTQIRKWRILRRVAGDPFEVSKECRDEMWKRGMVV